MSRAGESNGSFEMRFEITVKSPSDEVHRVDLEIMHGSVGDISNSGVSPENSMVLTAAEEQMVAKDRAKYVFTWFYLQLTNLFGYYAFIVLVPYFANEADNAGYNGDLIRNWLLPLNTLFLFLTHLFNMVFDVFSLLRGQYIILLGLLAWLVVYLCIAIFQTQPVVVLVCGVLQAVLSGCVEPQFWILSTFFPFAEKLRGQLGIGLGAAGLSTVFVHTIIRAIIYSTGQARQEADRLSFYIFFSNLFGMLAFGMGWLWYLIHMASWVHFEKRAGAVNVKVVQDNDPVPMLMVTNRLDATSDCMSDVSALTNISSVNTAGRAAQVIIFSFQKTLFSPQTKVGLKHIFD